jgi:hypothetical protein
VSGETTPSERKEGPETADFKRLVDDVSQTLQRTLADSPAVARCLGRIRAEGYEVSLVLEATIGLTRSGEAGRIEPPALDVRLEHGEPAQPRMTPLDKKFLRSLKISVEDEE